MTRAPKFRPAPCVAQLDADVLALWDTGLSIEEIAQALGVDDMRVAAIVAEIGEPEAADPFWEIAA